MIAQYDITQATTRAVGIETVFDRRFEDAGFRLSTSSGSGAG
jgi:hypothetical protein